MYKVSSRTPQKKQKIPTSQAMQMSVQTSATNNIKEQTEQVSTKIGHCLIHLHRSIRVSVKMNL